MADPTSTWSSPTTHHPGQRVALAFQPVIGSGGQSVNTSDSRVELFWDPVGSRVLTPSQRDRLRTSFTVVASEHRSQLQNRQAARHRLARNVVSALAGPRKRRRRTRPTCGSVTRRREAKRKRSQLKATTGAGRRWRARSLAETRGPRH